MEAVQTKPRHGDWLEKLKKAVTVVQGSDRVILAATLALVVFGSIMVISTQLGETQGDTRSLLFKGLKQGVIVVMAYGLMVWMSHVFNYRWGVRYENSLIILYIFLLLMVQAVGRGSGGSKAWLSIAGLSVQPSEFGKPLLILVMATSVWAARRSPVKQQTLLECFARPVLVLAVSTGALVLLQKDLGTLVITLLIGATGILIPRYKGLKVLQRIILIGLCAAIVLAVLFMLFSEQIAAFLERFPNFSYIGIRIENMVNPYLDVHESGYQPANALYAIADSGLFGKGLGASVRKYGFLTQAESDYILAVVIEETGLFGLIGVTAGYSLIVYRLIFWASRAQLTADRVLLASTAAYLGAHFFINVGGVGSLIPMTGVPLLFISAGGSSLWAVFIALGMAQARIAVIRRTNHGKASA